VRVAGDVAGGILFDAPPANNSTTDDDEDDDGVKDADEGVATVPRLWRATRRPDRLRHWRRRDRRRRGNAAGHRIVVKGRDQRQRRL
jgi:hypothetical protein